MKPKLRAEPSFSVKEDDRKSAGPAKDEDKGEEPLTELADRVRDIYIRERSKYEQDVKGMNGTFVPNRDWDGRSARQLDGKEVKSARRSVWEDLGEFVIRKRIDPHVYIAAVFSQLDVRAVVPTPMALCGPKADARWDAIRQGCERGVELAAKLETTTAIGQIRFHRRMSGYSATRACRVALTDDTLELSPLLRFCVAYAEQHYDISDYFFADAVMQFCRYEEFYLKYWKELLPRGFKKWAEKEYARITRRLYG